MRTTHFVALPLSPPPPVEVPDQMKQRLLREESPRWLAAQISEAGWVLVVELSSLKVFQEGRFADPRGMKCRCIDGLVFAERPGTSGAWSGLSRLWFRARKQSLFHDNGGEENDAKKGSVVAKSQERSQPQTCINIHPPFRVFNGFSPPPEDHSSSKQPRRSPQHSRTEGGPRGPSFRCEDMKGKIKQTRIRPVF